MGAICIQIDIGLFGHCLFWPKMDGKKEGIWQSCDEQGFGCMEFCILNFQWIFRLLPFARIDQNNKESWICWSVIFICESINSHAPFIGSYCHNGDYYEGWLICLHCIHFCYNLIRSGDRFLGMDVCDEQSTRIGGHNFLSRPKLPPSN